MLSLVACTAGILLGLYFSVFVLLPVSLAGIAIFVSVNLLSSIGAQLSDLLIPLISVQAGYMLGLTGRETYGVILARFQAAQSDRI